MGEAVVFEYPRKKKAARPRLSEEAAKAVLQAVGGRMEQLPVISEPGLPEDRQVAPRVIVSLAPDGALQMELRGASGLPNRTIRLKPGKEVEDITRVLNAQLASRVASGEDGAPTRAQVRHWEQHEIFPNSSCPFCISEGRTTGKSLRKIVREEVRGDGTVVVRTVKAKGRQLRSRKSLEESGL